ncbi:ABC transporter ATP-binding protein [Sinomonas sp. JGH33]|uniref:ABC transporter ATP-binding protein n=1 Tax=Sinomonas terricola TaxID=3110330 RepID=A0ABU5T5M9_9MICC|nr:ABC transporter ATP-binding protein [Sinomonas sp. JGH33]MEA5454980.1 ABC transporter ATP-binding protein [Sinomonas sp. JGH33]
MGDVRGIASRGLARSFGAVHAVAGMDFDARAGQVTALVGPNGAGKTTLLLMLASLLAPDAGTIRIDGFDPAVDRDEVRRRVGWMPDTLGVWESLTAREILVQMGRFYRLSGAEAASRADELLELVHLGSFASQAARVLSRGQQQRLSLARALIHRPTTLLLDEPAAGLDPASRVELRGTLRRLAGDGCTVVVSSHVLSELDEIADAVVFVSGGRTVRSQLVDAPPGGRRYALEALDLAPARARLGELGVEFGEEDGRRPRLSFIVATDDDAARLLRELVTAGVAVTAFAPAGGVIEETYLGLGADER